MKIWLIRNAGGRQWFTDAIAKGSYSDRNWCALLYNLLLFRCRNFWLHNCFGYYSFGFGYRRLYLWVIDSYFAGNLTERLSEFFLYFIGTFPLIPSLFIFITIVYLSKNFLIDSKSIVVFRLELFIIFIYIILLAFYGYYSRRLTYPVYLFIYLVLLRSTITSLRSYQGSGVSTIAYVIGFVSLVSWLFTLGPLV